MCDFIPDGFSPKLARAPQPPTVALHELEDGQV